MSQIASFDFVAELRLIMDADTAVISADIKATARTPWAEAWGGMVGVAAVAATAAMLVRGPAATSAGGIPAAGSGLFLPVLCLGVTVIAAGFDAATNRIPNPLTYTAVLVGVLVNCLALLLNQIAPRVASQWLGAAGPTQSALGLLLFGGIGLIGVVFAGMGGGDMKLLAAIGAMLGMSRASDVLICGAAVAVVYALVNLLIAGRLNATCRLAASHLLNWVYLRRWTLSDDQEKPASRRTIPLALPLLAGTMLAQTPLVANAIGWMSGVG
ncbi:prepilin peptidase [Humisphaera borealis]|uniref:Prepilin peptidase n=1 Tax=Humisphaera borealis TaxID=2807512 RepID=A0A7M2WSB3_9BACT|nr:prepilin peptidase [Humisphaera borealis]QOV88398.1 prepilin peptidase [Humisphaera borealis]